MTSHPTANQLAQFRKRQLPVEDIPALSAHLETCEQCREAMFPRASQQATFARLQAEIAGAHLSYEQIEAHIDGRLSEPDRRRAEEHIETCDRCAREVEDLQEFAHGLKSSTPPSTSESSWSARWAKWLPRPRYWAPLAAGTMAALLFLIFRTAPDPPPPQTHTLAADRTPDWLRDAVAKAKAEETIDTPDTLGSLGPAAPLFFRGDGSKVTFAPVRPVRSFVRPRGITFEWTPVRGADWYVVRVHDQNLARVAESPRLKQTRWVHARPLPVGAIYSWQVVARRGAKQLIAPAPPAQEARFAILGETAEAEITEIERMMLDDPLALAIAFARYGLIADAEEKLGELALANPQSTLPAKLRGSLHQLQKPAPTTTKPAQ